MLRAFRWSLLLRIATCSCLMSALGTIAGWFRSTCCSRTSFVAQNQGQGFVHDTCCSRHIKYEISTHQYTSVHISTHQYTTVHISTHQYTSVHIKYVDQHGFVAHDACKGQWFRGTCVSQHMKLLHNCSRESFRYHVTHLHLTPSMT